MNFAPILFVCSILFILKIVQSFWSVPSFRSSSTIQNRSFGGWPNASYNYFSWSYSCLQFRKFYKDVCLVTDTPGKKLLIDLLELPYTDYSTDLDGLSSYDPDLWAIGKLHAYGLQNAPFIHADGDVIIWDHLGEDLKDSELIVQNEDGDFSFYRDTLSEIDRHFTYVPDVMATSLKKNGGKIRSINAGIIGGNHMDFFKMYVDEAFAFIEKNKNHLNKIKKGKFNAVFEQYLFRCLSEQYGIKVDSFYKQTVKDYTEFIDLVNIPKKSTYFHPVGLFKKDEFVCRELECRFRMEYPEHYYHIAQLLQKRYL